MTIFMIRNCMACISMKIVLHSMHLSLDEGQIFKGETSLDKFLSLDK